MNKGVSRKSLAKLKEPKLPKKRKSHRLAAGSSFGNLLSPEAVTG
jgi:hypothetical protein